VSGSVSVVTLGGEPDLAVPEGADCLLAADREGIDATWNCLLPENLIAQALAPRMP
jgi:hypothetical protein